MFRKKPFWSYFSSVMSITELAEVVAHAHLEVLAHPAVHSQQPALAHAAVAHLQPTVLGQPFPLRDKR